MYIGDQLGAQSAPMFGLIFSRLGLGIVQADVQLGIGGAVLEQAFQGRGLAGEQRWITGETDGLEGNAAWAEVEQAIAVAVLIDLNRIATGGDVPQTQHPFIAVSLAQKLLGPVLLVGIDQGQMHGAGGLFALQMDQNVTCPNGLADE